MSIILQQIYINNLEKEDFPYKAIAQLRQQIVNVGVVIFDAVLYYPEKAQREINLETFGLEHQDCTLFILDQWQNVE